MQKYFDSVFGDSSGLRPIVGALVTVRNANNTLATIYSNNGTTVAPNPLTTDVTGYFEFYAPDGRYNITITADGFSSQIRNDVLFEDPQNASALVASTLQVTGNSQLGNAGTSTVVGGSLVASNGVNVLAGATSLQDTTVTSITASGLLTLSAGATNSILYLNAAKAAVTNAGFTYNPATNTISTNISGTAATATLATTATTAVNVSGGTVNATTGAFSGNITAATPLLESHLATKGYVDGLVSPVAIYNSPVAYVQSDTLDNMITKLLVLSGVIPQESPTISIDFSQVP
jgi:Carboxypeptidase regulatory-like domain